MKLPTRVGSAIVIATFGVVGALGLAGCSPGTAASAAMSPEATALTALGFTDTDVTSATEDVQATAAPTASPGTKAGNGKHRGVLRRLAIRRGLGRNIEHGSITVRTKAGDKTIDVQRGVVTAITATTVTIKSTDGYTATWTFGKPIRVIDHRSTVQPTAVVAGETVGVAGSPTGSTEIASLLVVANPSK